MFSLNTRTFKISETLSFQIKFKHGFFSNKFISKMIHLGYILVSDECCVESFRTFFGSVYKKL